MLLSAPERGGKQSLCMWACSTRCSSTEGRVACPLGTMKKPQARPAVPEQSSSLQPDLVCREPHEAMLLSAFAELLAIHQLTLAATAKHVGALTGRTVNSSIPVRY